MFELRFRHDLLNSAGSDSGGPRLRGDADDGLLDRLVTAALDAHLGPEPA
ncbi:hypothetical protein [Nonomuraea sp. NPDC050691]